MVLELRVVRSNVTRLIGALFIVGDKVHILGCIYLEHAQVSITQAWRKVSLEIDVWASSMDERLGLTCD